MKPFVFASWLAVTLVVGCVGEPPDNESLPGDTPDDTDGADDTDLTLDAADAIPNCNSVTTVLLYSEGTNELTLPNAFAAAADRCTHYYVNLPALSGDKTQPRMDADRVHALGPNFHAMAEFSWAAWRAWIAESPGTRDWALAGRVFRSRMTQAGYDVAHGDLWAINELPSTTRTGELDVWTHERQVVKALHDGDGAVAVKGVVYLAGMGQELQNFTVYKANVENWLRQSDWWAASWGTFEPATQLRCGSA